MQSLKEVTADWGVQIPTTFWDVRDDLMEEGNVTEYALVNAIAQPTLESYVDLEEDKELLSGHSSDEGMANADKALNIAVAEQYVPNFADDMRGTVEQMRCYLKEECT